MNVVSLLAFLALVLSATGAARAAADSPAPAQPAASAASAAQAGSAQAQCEVAVAKSIRTIRGAAVQDVQFGPEAQTLAGAGEHLDVKGTGHYRHGSGAPVAFRYSCEYDGAAQSTSGVLFHEVEAARPATLPVWRADLSALSPADCESAAAAALQAAHPRASGIVFDSDRRQLEPGEPGRTALVGTGHLTRSPGMAPGPFRYRCEFDAGGRLVAASVD